MALMIRGSSREGLERSRRLDQAALARARAFLDSRRTIVQTKADALDAVAAATTILQ